MHYPAPTPSLQPSSRYTNACPNAATPLSGQYPPTMNRHTIGSRPPPLNMDQVQHQHSRTFSTATASHYPTSATSPSSHDSRSRRISVVTTGDWKVSSVGSRPSSRMEKTIEAPSSFTVERPHDRRHSAMTPAASIIEPCRTPAYTPEPSSYRNSYFPPSTPQQQQYHHHHHQHVVASPQDYRMTISPTPTPGAASRNGNGHEQPFIGGFVIPRPPQSVQQQPHPSQYPTHVRPHQPHRPHPSTLPQQQRQPSFAELLPSTAAAYPAASSAATTVHQPPPPPAFSHRQSMPPPGTAMMERGAQTLPVARAKSVKSSSQGTVPALATTTTTAPSTNNTAGAAAASRSFSSLPIVPPSKDKEKQKHFGMAKQKRQITVQSINEEHRVWIDIEPNETGASLAHKIHVIATFRTKKILSITTASGRTVPLDRRRLFDRWAELDSFVDGEQWKVEWGDLDRSIVDRLLSKVVQTSEAS